MTASALHVRGFTTGSDETGDTGNIRGRPTGTRCSWQAPPAVGALCRGAQRGGRSLNPKPDLHLDTSLCAAKPIWLRAGHAVALPPRAAGANRALHLSQIMTAKIRERWSSAGHGDWRRRATAAHPTEAQTTAEGSAAGPDAPHTLVFVTSRCAPGGRARSVSLFPPKGKHRFQKATSSRPSPGVCGRKAQEPASAVTSPCFMAHGRRRRSRGQSSATCPGFAPRLCRGEEPPARPPQGAQGAGCAGQPRSVGTPAWQPGGSAVARPPNPRPLGSRGVKGREH